MSFPQKRSPYFSFARPEPAAAGEGAIAGVCALGFSLSAAITGAGVLAGAADAVFGAGSSTLTGAGSLIGQSDVVFDAGSSTLGGQGSLVGSSAIQFVNSGTALGAGALAGTSDVTFTATGTALAAGALSGAAALLFTASGAALGTGALAGAAAMLFSPSATAEGAGALSGTSSMTFDGFLNPGGAMQGTAAMQFTPSGALGGAAALSGTAGLVFAPVAVLQGSGAVSGAAAMQFSLSGSLAVTGLSGTITLLFGDGDSTLTGSGSVTLRRNALLPPIYDWAAESTLLQSMLGNSLPMRFYRHGRAPQDIAAGQYDYCTWFAFTGPENTLSEDPGIDRVSIQVDCWVRGGVDAEERIERLAQEVQRILETRGHCTGVPIDERDDKTKKFRIGVTFDIWWPRWS